MLRRCLLYIMSFSILLVSGSKIIACQWDLTPKILFITSYDNSHHQTTYDRIVYQKLKNIYGNKLVSTIFTHEEDNTYANILTNLIAKFGLEKVFILDPSFNNYFPKSGKYDLSGEQYQFDYYFNNNNLIRVLQQFTNVDFYFFNNQINNSFKETDNIYEFRFDSPNKAVPNLEEKYGALIAKHFYQQLVDPDTGKIANNKGFNFEVDKEADWVIKIGVIDNIGNSYQQNIIDEFVEKLNDNIPLDTKYEIKRIKISDWTLTYNFQNAQIVEQAANSLYQDFGVNFIFNSNSWFNNAIAYAASTTFNLPAYTKTIKFIANSVLNSTDYKYKNTNYMLFSYDATLDILDYTKENDIPEEYQLLDDAPENFNAYGVNNNLHFVDSL